MKQNPNPTSAEFRRHNYWKEALENLREVYDSACAYTTMKLVAKGSVDHFRPKSKYPQLAYEWSNYRLARQTINTRKGDTDEVLDPFTIQKGWFTLDLPSYLIKPGQELSRNMRVAVNVTINILGLNNNDNLVQERCRWLVDLADERITLDFLDRQYKFLALEVTRQGVQTSLHEIFSRPPLPV